MTAVSIEEPVSRLEGGYDHVATKADLAEFRAAATTDSKDLEIRLTSAISSAQNRLMAWTPELISVATGLIIALDRLFESAAGG